jgi:hypothetical protein
MPQNPQAVATIVQGDFNFDLKYTITDADGNPVNLAGATVTFLAQLQNDPTISFTTVCLVTDAAAGKVTYTVAETDFPVAGLYNCQLQAVYTGSNETVTADFIQVYVDARIPVSA